MRYFIAFLWVCSVSVLSAWAQSPAVGERAPELRVKEWLGAPAKEGKTATLIEFFSATNPVCVSRLPLLDSMANEFSGKLHVVLVTKEDISEIADVDKIGYSVAVDSDMRIFKTFGIQFVPSGVIVDEKGRVVWVGNTSSINRKTVKKWIDDGYDKDRPLRK